MLRDPRAVGHPVEVHLGGAERLAHGLEVADGDAGRVLRHIMLRAQGVETVLGRGVDEPVADRRSRLRTVKAEQQRVELALQRRRAPRAALIHEDDVAVAVDAGKGPRRRGVHLLRAHPGAAREHEQRVGRLALADGGLAGDGERDTPTLPGEVFWDLEGRALGLDPGQSGGVLEHAGGEGEGGVRRRGRRGGVRRGAAGGEQSEDAGQREELGEARGCPKRGRHLERESTIRCYAVHIML